MTYIRSPSLDTRPRNNSQSSYFPFSSRNPRERERERESIWSGAKPINFPRQRRIKRPILLLGLGFERNLLETISRPVPRQAVFNFSSPFSKTDTILGDRTLGLLPPSLPPRRIVKTAPPTSRGSRARYLTLPLLSSLPRNGSLG